MNSLIPSFPWMVVLYHFLGWLVIILLHIIFVGVAPKIDGEICEEALPWKKRMVDDGNNLFQFGIWNTLLLAAAHFLKWHFVSWIVFGISAIFAITSIIGAVPYTLTCLATVFIYFHKDLKAWFLIILSILAEWMTSAPLFYTAYYLLTNYVLR